MVMWRNRRESRAQHCGRLSSALVDEALQVFGALQCAYLTDGRIHPTAREQLRVAALDVLDDVAHLVPLVVAAPSWRAWPAQARQATSAPFADREASPAHVAVVALAEYTARLATLATLLAATDDDAATVFIGLAAAAEARMDVLAS